MKQTCLPIWILKPLPGFQKLNLRYASILHRAAFRSCRLFFIRTTPTRSTIRLGQRPVRIPQMIGRQRRDACLLTFGVEWTSSDAQREIALTIRAFGDANSQNVFRSDNSARRWLVRMAQDPLPLVADYQNENAGQNAGENLFHLQVFLKSERNY